MLYGTPVAWQSKLQPSISHSTAEAEIRALNQCCLKVLWLRRLCKEVTDKHVNKPTELYCDNRAAELWTRNPQHFARQQHIDRCDLSVREQVLEFKTVTVHLIPTHQQLADCFTKSLPLPAFRRNVQQLMESPTTADAGDKANCSQSSNDAFDACIVQSQHSQVEKECHMACEISPSPHHGGMLNSGCDEFTEQHNLTFDKQTTAKLLRGNFMDKINFAKEDPPLLGEERTNCFT